MKASFKSLKTRVQVERWELSRPFKIARGVKTHVDLVVVTLELDDKVGRGECSPLARYGEDVNLVTRLAETAVKALRDGEDWFAIHDTIPAGAARNAVDCAVWDLCAKLTGTPVWQMLELTEPVSAETVFTIGLDAAEVMASQALTAKGYNTLKVKLGSKEGDMDRLRAIYSAVPNVKVIVDANEAWSEAQLREYLPVMQELGVLMVEQPLPEGGDSALSSIPRGVPIGADESCHKTTDIRRLKGLYDLINIKLDKTGGLTEAVRLLKAAKAADMDTMVGCMLGTSLSMAPAMLLAPYCYFVDLDAPLLIGTDRVPGLVYNGATVSPPIRALWG